MYLSQKTCQGCGFPMISVDFTRIFRKSRHVVGRRTIGL
jgi:hypothetical protein